jgi:hypothetical protein
MMKTRLSLMSLAAAVAAFALATPASATVTGSTGAVVLNGTDGPAFSAIPDGAGQNNTIVYAWNELQNFTLGAGLTPEVLGPIAAGTVVNSHMLRFDPIQEGSAIGTATFDGPILGIFTSRGSLDLTDFLGSPTTAYPGHPSAPARGLEDVDFLAVTGPNSILIRWGASSPGDQIRVLTAGVPEPGSVALLAGMGIAGGLFLRRRVRK